MIADSKKLYAERRKALFDNLDKLEKVIAKVDKLEFINGGVIGDMAHANEKIEHVIRVLDERLKG